MIMMTIKSVTRCYLVTHVNASPVLSRLMVTDLVQALDYFWSQPCDDESIYIESFDIVDVIENNGHFEYKLKGMARTSRDQIIDGADDLDADGMTLELLLDNDDCKNRINAPLRGLNTDDPYIGEPLTYNDLITDIITDIIRGNSNRGIDITNGTRIEKND